MKYIDEKFKEISPIETVKNIQNILESLDIKTYERWNDSKVANCYSLTVHVQGGMPSTNGKGITKEFARASAYGEFIERLQCGLFFYKYQSFECDPAVNMQCYAPDGKYFTKEELSEKSTWIDFILNSYNGLTKDALLNQFEMYAHTDDKKILCVPFYSLFEDDYVYLPVGFIEHIYSANGCCAGNTKEEALVHAFSEIMERKASIAAITKGEPFAPIPEDILKSFPAVYETLTQLRESGNFDIQIFDCSIDDSIPVISTRIINKNTHGYMVNFAADPVLEIAIQRTLTEIFQAKNIDTIASEPNKMILNNVSDIRLATNVLNQLETGRGFFTVDYFTDELCCNKSYTNFNNNSDSSNFELLKNIKNHFKKLNFPVFIRNYSFLGFPCYKVIIPGFSESRGMKLTEPVQEYAIGHQVSEILKNPQKFDKKDLSLVFFFKKMIANTYSRENNFKLLSGLPIDAQASTLLMGTTMAYCAYKLENYKMALSYVDSLCRQNTITNDDKFYFECLRHYLQLNINGIEFNKILSILHKFHKEQYVCKLENNLKNSTPFDEFLLKCDPENCSDCRYKTQCHYNEIKKIIHNAGQEYSKFTDGQNRKNFF